MSGTIFFDPADKDELAEAIRLAGTLVRDDGIYSSVLWRGARRKAENAFAAGTVTIDVDYYHEQLHVGVPTEYLDRLDDLLHEEPIADLYYPTPRGARLIVVLPEIEHDMAHYQQVAWAVAHKAGQAITRGGLGNPSTQQGLLVDAEAGIDLARGFFLPE